MKISLNWLADYVELRGTPEELAARLTSAGLEVESVTRLGERFSGVVVAEVCARRPHPNAERLTLVTVRDDVGEHEVVCGAPNVPAAGGKVLWARPGARLPDGRVLGMKELKGARSAGMLCSRAELELGEEVEGGVGGGGDGIIVLSGEAALAAPGALAADALGLRDVVLEVNVTANRADCLSHVGIARELAALTGAALMRPAVPDLSGAPPSAQGVRLFVEDATACPHYVARVIEGITVGPSPSWLRRRLEAVGVRPISNVVDVTNYVMMELGQPLHAFNADALMADEVRVRRARAGEKLRTLDGVDRVLDEQDLVICDEVAPVALAGVMGGGAGCEVSPETTRVLLESACFDPATVRRTARRLGLHSESSHRFERGVDPGGVDFASVRAAALLAELGGGSVTAPLEHHARVESPRTIPLAPADVNALLGLELDEATITHRLESLGLAVALSGATLAVTVPTFRRDLERPVDLVEEVLRLAIDELPATLPVRRAWPAPSGDELAESARDALASAGLCEAITFGFTSRAKVAALRLPPEHPAMKPLAVTNPLTEEQAVLRTSLVPNLLAALVHNQKFGVYDVALFEVGHVFLASDGPLPDEPRYLAFVLAGERTGWLKPAGAVDLHDATGIVERLLGSLRIPFQLLQARAEHGFLHPGVAASIVVGGVPVGIVGEVHPETRAQLGVDGPVFACELSLERLPPRSAPQLAAIPRFPAVVRDLSFFVDESVAAARVRRTIDEVRPAQLESVRILDDYREAGKVPQGKKGLLWSLTYRAADRTLTDAEVDAAHESLLARLLPALGAERR